MQGQAQKYLRRMCQTRPARFEPQGRVGAGQDKVEWLISMNCPTCPSMENGHSEDDDNDDDDDDQIVNYLENLVLYVF